MKRYGSRVVKRTAKTTARSIAAISAESLPYIGVATKVCNPKLPSIDSIFGKLPEQSSFADTVKATLEEAPEIDITEGQVTSNILDGVDVLFDEEEKQSYSDRVREHLSKAKDWVGVLILQVDSS